MTRTTIIAASVAATAAVCIAGDLAVARYAPLDYLGVVEIAHGCKHLKVSDASGYDTWQCGPVTVVNVAGK